MSHHHRTSSEYINLFTHPSSFVFHHNNAVHTKPTKSAGRSYQRSVLYHGIRTLGPIPLTHYSHPSVAQLPPPQPSSSIAWSYPSFPSYLISFPIIVIVSHILYHHHPSPSRMPPLPPSWRDPIFTPPSEFSSSSSQESCIAEGLACALGGVGFQGRKIRDLTIAEAEFEDRLLETQIYNVKSKPLYHRAPSASPLR